MFGTPTMRSNSIGFRRSALVQNRQQIFKFAAVRHDEHSTFDGRKRPGRGPQGRLYGAPPAPSQWWRNRPVAMLSTSAGGEPGGGRAGNQRCRRHEANNHRTHPRAPRRTAGIFDDLGNPSIGIGFRGSRAARRQANEINAILGRHSTPPDTPQDDAARLRARLRIDAVNSPLRTKEAIEFVGEECRLPLSRPLRADRSCTDRRHGGRSCPGEQRAITPATAQTRSPCVPSRNSRSSSVVAPVERTRRPDSHPPRSSRVRPA
jgi:hypothetical protein